jgi:hypothetical protein
VSRNELNFDISTRQNKIECLIPDKAGGRRGSTRLVAEEEGLIYKDWLLKMTDKAGCRRGGTIG